MTTLPASQAAAVHAPQRSLAAQAPVAAGATIDPIKLVNRYKFLLIGAAIAGAAVGTVAHVVLKRVYPIWTPAAVFECLQPMGEGLDSPNQIGTEEMLRFMQTQVQRMTSAEVLKKVSDDPSLPRNAPSWAKPFFTTDKSTGAPTFDTIEAYQDLKDDVKARVIPGTNFVELSMRGHDKHDATTIVGMVRQQFMSLIDEQGRSGRDNSIQALNETIAEQERKLKQLSARKEEIIASGQIDSIDSRVEAERQELADTTIQLIEVQRAIDAGSQRMKQMQAEVDNPGGIAFGDELKNEVDKHPQVLEQQAQIQRMENDLQGLLQLQYDRTHRQCVLLDTQITAAKQNLETKRDELLKKMFSAQLDSTRKAVSEYEAQEASLKDRADAARKRLQDLAKKRSEYNEVDDQLKSLLLTKAKLSDDLVSLQAKSRSNAVNRVVPAWNERPPDEMSFPKLKLLLPAGAAIFLLLTAGTVLLIEIVDQRVKGPADIAIIPRTRLVGWVPDASEDPAGAGAVETAFRDRPKGIVAESFRQIRATIMKRLQQTPHRTILIASGMPTSGATSFASNLAIAFASADKKVLLIDANFRRPGLHRVFGIPEAPGLADVLGKQKDLAQAVQATSTPNLDLLCAGAKDQRVYERLSTDAMSELLAKVRSMYDVILVDVAPAVVGGDAFALAQRCDASILVARAMVDKRGMVARIKNELSETRGEFLGVIVNGVKSAAGGYMKRNIKTAHEYQSA